MRRICCLAVLLVAVPVASWASSSADSQNVSTKANYLGGILSTHSLGSGFSNLQGLNGKSDTGAQFGKFAFAQAPFNRALLKGGIFATKETSVVQGSGRPAVNRISGRFGAIAIPVPEPGTLSLLGGGLVVLAGLVRFRSRSRV